MSLLELSKYNDVPFIDSWSSLLFDDILESNGGHSRGHLFPTDIFEKDGNLHINAELPGVSKEDINIEIKDGLISLKCEKQLLDKGDGDSYYLKECRSGNYERSFKLPDFVETDGIVATFNNGILSISLPKKEDIEGRKIAIN